MNIYHDLKQYIDNHNYQDNIQPECFRPTIGRLLPGGELFVKLRLRTSMELDKCFRNIQSRLDKYSTQDTYTQTAKLADAISTYLHVAENFVQRTIDLSSPVHQSFLLTLRELSPPPNNNQPTLFLIAGPSASGKDYITHNTMNALRARGFSCQFILKYILRDSRSEERKVAPFLRYQIVLSENEYHYLKDIGEIVCPYWKYKSQYGLSRSNLDRLLKTHQASVNVCIMSAFEQADMFIEYLQNIGFRVIPILIHADLGVCRHRLLNRLLNIRDNENFDENKIEEELWIRAEEVAKDIDRIRNRDDVIERIYIDRITNNANNDNRPIQELYQFIIAKQRLVEDIKT